MCSLSSSEGLRGPCRYGLKGASSEGSKRLAADPSRASKGPDPRVESTYFLDPLQSGSELRVLGGSQARSESQLLMVGELDNLTQPNLCTSK